MEDKREQIKSLRLERPELTLGKIAAEVGRTRERVRQVLMEEGLPTRALRPKRIRAYCLNCGKEVPHGNSKFCSRACYHDYRLITLRCDFCGREFKRSKSQTNRDKESKRHVFCSKTCHGKWLAKWYCVAQLRRKLDYERIRQLHDEGYNALHIAMLTGENFTSIYGAIYRMGLRFRRSGYQKQVNGF